MYMYMYMYSTTGKTFYLVSGIGAPYFTYCSTAMLIIKSRDPTGKLYYLVPYR